MQKLIQFSVLMLFVTSIFSSCDNPPKVVEKTNNIPVEKTVVTNFLTKEARDKMTPDMVLQDLMDGNKKFVANKLSPDDIQAQIKNAAAGQNPKAIILSCIDSRVPVEEIFDQNIGDIFVARVAGNVVDEDILGSMEYATEHAGAKLVIVVGHKGCGAVKAAVDNVVEGNITALVSKIKPSVAENKAVAGEKNSKNAALVDAVCKSNIKNDITNIRKKSETMSKLEKEGKIKIVGAYYDLDNGVVTEIK